MNTQPDEATITRWIDGELQGEELARMDAYAAEHPELIAERDAIRAMNASIRENVPASVEPPYADFFNQRILRHLEDEQQTSAQPTQSTSGNKKSFWQWLAVPAAAAAMALCFYMGTRVAEPTAIDAPNFADVTSVYTPDVAVKADVINAKDANATVIVLEGLDDIPDDFEMVGQPAPRQDGAVMVSAGTFY